MKKLIEYFKKWIENLKKPPEDFNKWREAERLKAKSRLNERLKLKEKHQVSQNEHLGNSWSAAKISVDTADKVSKDDFELDDKLRQIPIEPLETVEESEDINIVKIREAEKAKRREKQIKLLEEQKKLLKQQREQREQQLIEYRITEQERRKFVEKLEEEKRKLEEQLQEQKKIEIQSFIKQFARKYGGKASNTEYLNLQMILADRQFEITLIELKDLVNKENNRQQIEGLKSKIFEQNPHNRAAILKSYLNLYRSDDEITLKLLVEILEERYSSPENIIELKNEIKTIEKRIELENFEKRLFEENKQIRLEDVDQLNGYEFEDFLKSLFSKMGYQVEQTKLSGDQGADLVVVKFGEKTVIQAKRFGGKVGNKAVQEILAAISLYQAQKGMVITNNYFTPAAVELANANNIELLDRDGLEELINKHW